MRRSSPGSALFLRAAALLGALGAWCVPGALAALPASVTPAADAQRRDDIVAGMPLAEALLALEARGLPLLFSSRVVRPEMRVVALPDERDPRRLLETLLAPHGLTVEDRGGTLVVVAAAPARSAGGLRGVVRSRHALVPLAGVTVLLVDSGVARVTDREGRFGFPELGPGTHSLQARKQGFVIEQLAAVVEPDGASPPLEIVLQPAPLAGEEIVVHAGRVSLLRDDPVAAFALSREEIAALPQLAGDAFRALSLLPGTAGDDISAQMNVRGGRRDEVRVLLDGQELYEAYHLRELDGALAVVPTAALGSLDLTTGAFGVAHGDRMGGVLEMATRDPGQRRLRLALGIIDAQAEAAGARAGLGWLVSARRGQTEHATELFGRDENPVYWDVLGRADLRPSDRQALGARLLATGDRLDFVEVDGSETTAQDTEYGTTYLWLTHQAVLGDRLFVDSALSGSRGDRDRRVVEDDSEKKLELRDVRHLDVIGVLQSWNLQAGERHFVSAGVEARRYEADFDYASFREFDSPLVVLRSEPREGVFAFDRRIEDEHVGAHALDRFQPREDLTLEAGARFDRHGLAGESAWSPRASLAWRAGEATVLRLGWGRYHQSQRAYELMVEDGDPTVYPLERAEHWVAGVERIFAAGRRAPLQALRAEAYRRRIADPRPRYENLFEPFSPFPEGELDRFRFAPERSRADGIELSLRGALGARSTWWLNYGWARSEDRLGGAWVPRLVDQRHTLNVDLATRLGHWDVNLAWRFHTGRPTTAIALVPPATGGDDDDERPDGSGDDDDGEGEDDGEGSAGPPPTPVLGPLDGERLPDYHRLDLRLSRRWRLRSGELTFYVDVQNLYDRANVAGLDVEVDEGELVIAPEPWPGFFASAGIAFEL